ncbi:MAG: gephyrin-like molybdotransferase Glp [Pseudomonadota bacterium]
MISVEAALGHLFDLVSPLGTEAVPLGAASGRVLAQPVTAYRDQPPFPTSVMDGYAVRSTDIRPGAVLRVVGEAAAGHEWSGALAPGAAVRIFTGAPVPSGADRVLIQEDATRDGETITVGSDPDTALYIRAAGTDFRVGDRIMAPRRLKPSDLVLAAAMNAPHVICSRKPDVVVMSTGDELVMPGARPRPDQIIASNAFGLAALLENEGAVVRRLPIARDTCESLDTAFDLARGSDLIVTIGGASVGDHDLVKDVAQTRGMTPSFYKVAMRPGKPLTAGMMGDTPLIGLPGNPVSAMVCGIIFVRPTLRAMMGLPAQAAPSHSATLASDIGPNGPREHYMRALLDGDAIRPFERQDSGLMGILAEANALLVRAPNAPTLRAGSRVDYVAI